MQIKVTGIKLDAATGETAFDDISDLISDVKLSGSSKECTWTLNFKMLRTDVDVTMPKYEINLGDAIKMSEVDESGNTKDFFSGVIWSKKIDDNSIDLDITAYDKSIYLNKNEPDTQVFTQMTPQAVASAIISELGLNAGTLASGSVDDYNLRGLSGYDAIMACYTKESEKTGKKYKLVFKDDKVNIYEDNDRLDIVLEELDEALPGKILHTSFSETLDDVINEVKVIEDEEKDEKKEKKSKPVSQERYGTMQAIKKGKPADVAGIMKDSKKDVDVECIGTWDMVTGKSIYLKSSIIEGRFYIVSDEHTLDDAIHTCNLKLSTEHEMDTKKESTGGETD